MAETIITLVKCLNQYGGSSVRSERLVEDTDSPLNISVNVALSHINIFLIVDKDMCLMTRVDAVTIEKNASKSGAVVSGFKVVDMVPYKGELEINELLDKIIDYVW